MGEARSEMSLDSIITCRKAKTDAQRRVELKKQANGRWYLASRFAMLKGKPRGNTFFNLVELTRGLHDPRVDKEEVQAAACSKMISELKSLRSNLQERIGVLEAEARRQ